MKHEYRSNTFFILLLSIVFHFLITGIGEKIDWHHFYLFVLFNTR